MSILRKRREERRREERRGRERAGWRGGHSLHRRRRRVWLLLLATCNLQDSPSAGLGNECLSGDVIGREGQIKSAGLSSIVEERAEFFFLSGLCGKQGRP